MNDVRGLEVWPIKKGFDDLKPVYPPPPLCSFFTVAGILVGVILGHIFKTSYPNDVCGQVFFREDLCKSKTDDN